MASNLAVWISIVSDETNHALEYERYHHDHSSMKGAVANLNHIKAELMEEITDNKCNITESVNDIFTEVVTNTTEFMGE